MRVQSRSCNHMVIEAPIVAEGSEHHSRREWDMVDVQLCVSRELRQRGSLLFCYGYDSCDSYSRSIVHVLEC